MKREITPANTLISLYATTKDGEELLHQGDLKTISEMYNKIVKDIIRGTSPYSTARIKS